MPDLSECSEEGLNKWLPSRKIIIILELFGAMKNKKGY